MSLYFCDGVYSYKKYWKSKLIKGCKNQLINDWKGSAPKESKQAYLPCNIVI